jgi:flagellar hook-associated protein 1
MSDLSIGQTALSVSQKLLDLVGQNVANANTPGYHLQVASLAALTSGQPIGNGVEVTAIARQISSVLEQSLNNSASASGSLSAELSTLQQIQTQLSSGNGTLSNLLTNFFTQAQQLSSNPSDPTQRSVFLQAGQSLAQGINSLNQDFLQLQQGLDAQGAQSVATANSLTSQIAQLNGNIQLANAQGADVNDLTDQRDQLISQLAQIVDVHTLPQGDGVVNVIAGNVPVVMGTQSLNMQYNVDSKTGAATITAVNGALTAQVSGGQLAGVLDARNQDLGQLQQQLTTLTSTLITSVDEIQATGVPSSGSFSQLSGARATTSITAPLDKAGLAFPPQAGTLSVSVINQATGKSTLTQIQIDPSTQSLQDVANSLSGIAHLQALVDPQSKTLTILAQPGYTFNFAGQLPSAPDQTAITGSATASLAGSYTGTTNDRYTFTVVGSGTVGVTPNLSVKETNSAGTVLGTFNIGQGYQPGSVLQTANGVGITLTAGSMNAGDSFSTPVVANADTAGILPALGLNSFFTGDGPSNVSVRSDLLASPGGLATSLSGQPADSSNLQRLVALNNNNLMAGGTQTMQQFFSTMVGNVGSQVQNLTSQQTAQQAVTQQLQSQQQSVSGVDPNEQLLLMTQYQRSYQMAAQFISVCTASFNFLMTNG